MQQTLSLFSHLIHLSLIQLLFYFLMFCIIHNYQYQILLQDLLQSLSKCLLFLCILWGCLYLYIMISLFLHILVLRNPTKTHTEQFYLFLVFIDLNRLFCFCVLFIGIANTFSVHYSATEKKSFSQVSVYISIWF